MIVIAVALYKQCPFGANYVGFKEILTQGIFCLDVGGSNGGGEVALGTVRETDGDLAS